MLIYKAVKCFSPYCQNRVMRRVDSTKSNFFCKDCKKQYPLGILRLQVLYNLPIKNILIDVSRTYKFESVCNVASVLGVDRKVFQKWLKDIFELSWSEFRKEFVCQSTSCYLVKCSSLFSFRYKNKYYLVQKLKKEFNICSCLYKDDDKKGVITKNTKIIVNLLTDSKLSDLHISSVALPKKNTIP